MRAAGRSGETAEPQPIPWILSEPGPQGGARARATEGIAARATAYLAALALAALACGCAPAGAAAAPPRVGLRWATPPDPAALAEGPQPEPYDPGPEERHAPRQLLLTNQGDKPLVVRLYDDGVATDPLVIPAHGERTVLVVPVSGDPRALVASVRAAPDRAEPRPAPEAHQPSWVPAFLSVDPPRDASSLPPGAQGANEGAPFTQACSPPGLLAAPLSQALPARGRASSREAGASRSDVSLRLVSGR